MPSEEANAMIQKKHGCGLGLSSGSRMGTRKMVLGVILQLTAWIITIALSRLPHTSTTLFPLIHLRSLSSAPVLKVRKVRHSNLFKIIITIVCVLANACIPKSMCGHLHPCNDM